MNAPPEPEFLYRYRHLRGPHREYSSKILTDSLLYFASPRAFNDPFDCKVHFVLRASKAALRLKYEDLVRTRRPELNREQRRAKVARDVRRVDLTTFVNTLTASLQEEINRLGVLSLASNTTSPLLWSHYSAGHTGLCLQFRGQSDAPFFGRAQPVVYSTGYPQVDPVLDSRDRLVEALLLTKARDWVYEEEWRIIDHQTGPGLKTFPEELLVGVILGARMTADDRRYVADLLKKRHHPVQLYEAVVGDGTFALKIRSYAP